MFFLRKCKNAHVFFNDLHRVCTFSTKQTKLRAISYPISGKTKSYVKVSDAVKLIKSGSSIFVHGFAATPSLLLNELSKFVQNSSLKNLRLHHIILCGTIPWDNETFNGKIRSNCFFISDNLRKMVSEGRADYTPVFLSEIPKLFNTFQIPVDVALITVSPADAHGYCTLGVNIEGVYDAIKAAKTIIALENSSMPRTFGDTVIHVSHIDALVRDENSIHQQNDQAFNDPSANAIGKLVAENLVDNSSTIQIGLGTMPDAALLAMHGHKNLGVHTELLGDGIIDLIEKNVITNSAKTIDHGKIVTSLAYGTEKLYKFINNNPLFLFKSSSYTNNRSIIGRQHKMIAINSAIEVDITGQCVSGSIGSTFYSGFGGQLDFIYGAANTIDGLGKSIITLPSTTKHGESKIVPMIKQGAGVVITRGHVRYVVTEFGIAQLWGKSVRQRAYELIRIAHPKHRETLEKQAYERLKCMPSQA